MKRHLKYYNILYAEDNKALQMGTVEYLKRYFGKVYVANNGKEALSLYDKHKIDVLLLDIDMPILNGLDVAEMIRRYNETIPIIILTAYTDTKLLLRATELNLCKYLVKPLNPIVFKDILEKVHTKLLVNNQTIIKLSDGYIWNFKTKVLIRDDIPIFLSQKVQALFALLMQHYDKCVSFEEIMAIVLEDELDNEISRQSVKLQVTLLRKKLPEHCIDNVYGKGYLIKFD